MRKTRPCPTCSARWGSSEGLGAWVAAQGGRRCCVSPRWLRRSQPYACALNADACQLPLCGLQVDRVADWGDILQIAVLDLIRKVDGCRAGAGQGGWLHACPSWTACRQQDADNQMLACHGVQSVSCLCRLSTDTRSPMPPHPTTPGVPRAPRAEGQVHQNHPGAAAVALHGSHVRGQGAGLRGPAGSCCWWLMSVALLSVCMLPARRNHC